MIVVSGSGTPYAVIGATYPAGSTCTCTNGTRTVTLKDTSGTGLFKIPYAGTWTVTATNGTDTVSQSVTISVKGQVETVTLDYGLYIIKNGKIQSIGLSKQLRSGYKLNVTDGDTAATLKYGTSGYTSAVVTDSPIDLTKWSTLYCDGIATGTSYSFVVTNNVSSYTTFTSMAAIPTAFTTTPAIDVSQLSGEYYVGFYYKQGNITASIPNFWLE